MDLISVADKIIGLIIGGIISLFIRKQEKGIKYPLNSSNKNIKTVKSNSFSYYIFSALGVVILESIFGYSSLLILIFCIPLLLVIANALRLKNKISKGLFGEDVSNFRLILEEDFKEGRNKILKGMGLISLILFLFGAYFYLKEPEKDLFLNFPLAYSLFIFLLSIWLLMSSDGRLEIKSKGMIFGSSAVGWDDIKSYSFGRKSGFEDVGYNYLVITIKKSLMTRLYLVDKKILLRFSSENLPSLEAALAQVVGHKQER